MNGRISAFCAVLMMVTATAFAAPRPLTMDEAIDLALKQNKKVSIAKLGVDKADAKVSEALGHALPTLNLSAAYTRNIQVPVFFIPDFQNPSSGALSPVRVGLNNQYQLQAQATQILFNSAVFSGIGASKVYYNAALEQLNSAIAEVVTDTKKKYFDAMMARELGRISQATLDNAMENFKTIDALFKEGLVAEFDLIRSQVAVDNIRPSVTESEAVYANAIGALQTHIGMDMGDSVVPVGEFQEEQVEFPDEQMAIETALRENKDLKALEYQVRVTKEFISLYTGEYFPTLSLFGNWMHQGQSDTYTNFVSAPSSAVGLNFQINLFNGFQTKARVEQANIDHQTVQEQYNQLKDIVKLQVRAVLNTLRSSKLRILAQRSTVTQAQRGLEIARIRYKEGTGSLLELNDSELALSHAQINRIQALHDYHTTKADYDRVVASIDRKYFRTVETN